MISSPHTGRYLKLYFSSGAAPMLLRTEYRHSIDHSKYKAEIALDQGWGLNPVALALLFIKYRKNWIITEIKKDFEASFTHNAESPWKTFSGLLNTGNSWIRQKNPIFGGKNRETGVNLNAHSYTKLVFQPIAKRDYRDKPGDLHDKGILRIRSAILPAATIEIYEDDSEIKSLASLSRLLGGVLARAKEIWPNWVDQDNSDSPDALVEDASDSGNQIQDQFAVLSGQVEALADIINETQVQVLDIAYHASPGEQKADIEFHEILTKASFLDLLRKTSHPGRSPLQARMLEKIVSSSWATLCYRTWGPSEIAVIRALIKEPLNMLLEPLLLISLGEAISEATLLNFLRASQSELFSSDAGVSKMTDLLVYRLVKRLCYEASPVLGSAEVLFLLEFERKILRPSEEAWFDLYLRLSAGYISPSPEFASFISRLGQSWKTVHPINSILYECVVHPFDVLHRIGFMQVKQNLIDAATVCCDALQARWIVSAYGRLASVSTKSNNNEEFGAELEAEIRDILLAFPMSMRKASSFLAFGVVQMFFAAFAKNPSVNTLAAFEHSFLTAKDVLHPNQNYYIQAELVSYLLSSREASWLIDGPITTSAMAGFIRNGIFNEKHEKLLRNPTSQLVIRKIAGSAWRYLQDYLRELRGCVVFPILRTNLLSLGHLRAFKRCWNNRDTLEGLPKLLQDELRNISSDTTRITPQFACRLMPLWREVTCNANNEQTILNARCALDTLRIAGRASDIDILLNDFAISQMIWQLSKYAYGNEKDVCSELEKLAARVSDLRNSLKSTPSMTDFYLVSIFRKKKAEVSASKFRMLMLTAFRQKYGKGRPSLIEDIAFPADELVSLLSASASNLFASIGSNEINNPEFWNSLATFLIEMAPEDHSEEALTGNLLLYNQALYLADTEHFQRNKFFYNLANSYGQCCLYLDRIPETRALSFIFDHVFSFTGQKSHWTEDRLRPLFEVINKYWPHLSKVRIEINRKERTLEEILLKREWLGRRADAYKWIDRSLKISEDERLKSGLERLAKEWTQARSGS